MNGKTDDWKIYCCIDKLRGVENLWLFFDDVKFQCEENVKRKKKIKLAKRMIGMQNID